MTKAWLQDNNPPDLPSTREMWPSADATDSQLMPVIDSYLAISSHAFRGEGGKI